MERAELFKGATRPLIYTMAGLLLFVLALSALASGLIGLAKGENFRLALFICITGLAGAFVFAILSDLALEYRYKIAKAYIPRLVSNVIRTSYSDYQIDLLTSHATSILQIMRSSRHTMDPSYFLARVKTLEKKGIDWIDIEIVSMAVEDLVREARG